MIEHKIEHKEEEMNSKLQERVLSKMFVFCDLTGGVVKVTIPDDIFSGEREVEIEGKHYGIYSIPGVEGAHGGSKIIEQAIDKFVSGHGAPSWSQIVNEVAPEPNLRNQLISYPKTVYLKA